MKLSLSIRRLAEPFAALAALVALTFAGCATSPSAANNPNVRRNQSRDDYAQPQRTGVYTGSNFVQGANVAGNRADTASPTSVYGQGDIQRTGQNGVGSSLRRLDPSISGGGY